MRNGFLLLFCLVFLWISNAQAGEAVKWTPNCPTRYVVKPGDNVWQISGCFLQKKWLSKVWYINPFVSDANRIYAGDVFRCMPCQRPIQNYHPSTCKNPLLQRKTVVLFRIFEKVSYALILEATNPVRLGDIVKNT